MKNKCLGLGKYVPILCKASNKHTVQHKYKKNVQNTARCTFMYFVQFAIFTLIQARAKANFFQSTHTSLQADTSKVVQMLK